MLLTERAIRQLIYNILLEGVREDATALEVMLADDTESLEKFRALGHNKWVPWIKKNSGPKNLKLCVFAAAAFNTAGSAINQKYMTNPEFKSAIDSEVPNLSGNITDINKITVDDMAKILDVYFTGKKISWRPREVNTANQSDIENLKSLLAAGSNAGNQNAASSIDRLSDKWKQWLIDRFVHGAVKQEDNLADTLTSISYYAEKEPDIASDYAKNSLNKYTGKKFRDFVDKAVPVSASRWKNPSDTALMTLADIRHILSLHKAWSDRISADTKDTSWQLPVEKGGDKIGTFGDWTLYFPSSQQNSINIAGADPVTHQPYTTWCTGSTSAENLFYAYTGEGIMLFYAINTKAALKNSKDPKGRICLGFSRGVLDASGKYGGITVDAENNGLKMADLQLIFGGHTDSIISAAQTKIKQLGGKHPAEAEFEAAAKDYAKFEQLIRGLGNDAIYTTSQNIFNYNPTYDFLDAASTSKHEPVKYLVALYDKTPAEILVRLALSKSSSNRVRVNSVMSSKIPADILIKLANDYPSIRSHVLNNPNAPAELMTAEFAKDDNMYDRAAIAASEKTGADVLKLLARDAEVDVRVVVASNSITDIDLLKILARDEHHRVRAAVAKNPKITEKFKSFEHFLNDEHEDVRIGLAKNSKIPETVLRALAADSSKEVRRWVAASPKTPKDLYAIFGEDDSMYEGLAENSKTPETILRKIADKVMSLDIEDPDNRKQFVYVLARLARNPSTPIDLLKKLVTLDDERFQFAGSSMLLNPALTNDMLRYILKNSKNRRTQDSAQSKLEERGITESRRLAYRILREIKRTARN